MNNEMSKCEFKPFQQVLVRNDEDDQWQKAFFDRYFPKSGYPYSVVSGDDYIQCIPFEGNEHLDWTTDPYELPYEPQDGDFVAFGDLEGDKRALQIFKSNGDGSHYAYVTLPLCLDTRDYEEKVDIDEDFEYSNINIRPATEEEKQLLLSRLHEAGKDWNPGKKEVVDWKWKPNDGDIVYFPCFNQDKNIFEPMSTEFSDSCTMESLEAGNCSRTEDECWQRCNRLSEAIKGIK